MVLAVSLSLLLVFFFAFFFFHVVTNIWDSRANPFFGAIVCRLAGVPFPQTSNLA